MVLTRNQRILALFLQLLCHILGERTHDKMYRTISGSSCFRRLNATHSTGCSSAFTGSVGVLHYINSVNDFDFIMNKPPAPPYTLIVPPALFTRENIMNVVTKAANHVAGIVLINNTTELKHYSHESKCPNQFGGLLKGQTCDVNKAQTAWNPFGTGLLHEDYPFPIYYVKDKEDIQQILDCYKKYNSFDQKRQHSRPLCSIQIKSFMSASVNSVVCIRRSKYLNNVNPTRYCDPLQGKNVYATLFPRAIVKQTDNLAATDLEQFIVVAARIDTTSMFDGVGLGALDSLVPMVALISTAHTLAKLLPKATDAAKFNVLFILFNGESYDYIGSQRLVYDMEKGEFPAALTATKPIMLENIKLFVDIGSLDDVNSISLYQYNEFALADNLHTLISNYNTQWGFNITTSRKTTVNLPPTSAQTFLRDNATFPAMILYADTHKNRFYHSIYDDEKNINFKYYNTSSNDYSELVHLDVSTVFPTESIQIALRNISTLLAFSLYELVLQQKYTANFGANPHLVDELLYCYLHSADCRLFKAAVKPNSIIVQPHPPQRYISVQGSLTYETIGWTYQVLGFLTGQNTPETEDNCTTLPLAWFAGVNGKGECKRTTQNISNAYSPAFTIDNYDWSSGRYSTWTESTWREINARIFLKPSLSHEALTLAIGFIVMIISFVFVFLVNSKSDILFGDSTSSVNALTLPSQC